MHWLAKSTLQAIISRLPRGQFVYASLQRIARTNPLDIHDQYGMKAKFLRWLTDQHLEIRNRRCLEIGTGWYPVLPVLLSVLEADRVITLDRNTWLTAANMDVTLRGFISIAPRIAADFGIEPSRVVSACRAPLLAAERGHLHEALEALRIEYRTRAEATRTGLPTASCDLVVSSNVLEHVPPEVIRAMFVESRRLLRSRGAMAHHVNPGDHTASPDGPTTANFLKFSPAGWYFIGGSGLAYHNRLRCRDYLKLTTDCGFTVSVTRSKIDQRALAALKRGAIAVHEQFRAFSCEDLACDIIDMIAVPCPDGPRRALQASVQ